MRILVRTIVPDRVYVITSPIVPENPNISRNRFAVSVIHWAHENIGQGLNYYLDYHEDSYSMVIIKDINDFPLQNENGREIPVIGL